MTLINTYESYLEHPAGDILRIEEAANIYKDMAESINKCSLDDKMDFWNECIRKAMEYNQIRNTWEFMSREEKMEADSGRTLKHDSFITSLNVLSRIAEQEGVDNSWRGKLGDKRKRIGDFACYISYITGISNR